MLLDSTFINALARGGDTATDTLEELITAETPVAVSALTVFEVGVGLHGEAAQYRERFDAMIDTLEIIPITATDARRAITIQRELYEAGKPIGVVDVLIVATAAGRPDPQVLTRNVDEFARVDRIEVKSY